MAKIDFAINSEGQRVSIHSEKLNRHGFIAGATGTGKTVSLKVLAEHFSALSIPVFLSDFKGDLSGLFKAGEATEKIEERSAGFPIVNFPTEPFRWSSSLLRRREGFRLELPCRKWDPCF